MKCPNCGYTSIEVDGNSIPVRFQDNLDGSQDIRMITVLPTSSFEMYDTVRVSGMEHRGSGKIVWKNKIDREVFLVAFRDGDVREVHSRQLTLQRKESW